MPRFSSANSLARCSTISPWLPAGAWTRTMTSPLAAGAGVWAAARLALVSSDAPRPAAITVRKPRRDGSVLSRPRSMRGSSLMSPPVKMERGSSVSALRKYPVAAVEYFILSFRSTAFGDPCERTDLARRRGCLAVSGWPRQAVVAASPRTRCPPATSSYTRSARERGREVPLAHRRQPLPRRVRLVRARREPAVSDGSLRDRARDPGSGFGSARQHLPVRVRPPLSGPPHLGRRRRQSHGQTRWTRWSVSPGRGPWAFVCARLRARRVGIRSRSGERRSASGYR